MLVAGTELPKLNTGLLGTTAAGSCLFSAGFPKTNGVVDCLIVATSGGFLAPNVKPSVAAQNANKSQVKTPKRDSPATIAAKGKD